MIYWMTVSSGDITVNHDITAIVVITVNFPLPHGIAIILYHLIVYTAKLLPFSHCFSGAHGSAGDAVISPDGVT